MKKMFFMAAIAALALSSCSSDELVQGNDSVVEDGAVSFGAYVGRENRALESQNVTLAGLKSEKGFGVFAYEQGATPFLSYLAGNTYPNFMYNQNVTWQAGPAEWTYTPLKYWPNNNGYVTFQAYAPYNADVTPVFNVAQNGVGIRYNNSENYDLLWGASAAADESKCFYDQQKPSINDRTLFNFKHALSKLDFTVSYFSEKAHEGDGSTGTADGTIALDTNTEIVVRSIKLVGDQPSQGVLSLYDGKWTIEKMDANIGWNTSDLTKDGSDAALAKNGTLTNSVKVVKPEKSLMVIPTSTPAHVEITYDVITTDSSDPRNNSVVTNTVSSKATNLYPSAHNFAGINLTAGKWTTVNIHIGLTSVKFDAVVSNWDDNAAVNQDVDLPNNAPAIPIALTALTAATPEAITIDGTTWRIEAGKLQKYDTEWTGATLNAYYEGKNIYKVTETDGTFTKYVDVDAYTSSTDGNYIVWNGTAYVEVTPTVLKSLTPDSANRVYDNSDAVVAVNEGDYVLCGGKLYKWDGKDTAAS